MAHTTAYLGSMIVLFAIYFNTKQTVLPE